MSKDAIVLLLFISLQVKEKLWSTQSNMSSLERQVPNINYLGIFIHWTGCFFNPCYQFPSLRIYFSSLPMFIFPGAEVRTPPEKKKKRQPFDKCQKLHPMEWSP